MDMATAIVTANLNIHMYTDIVNNLKQYANNLVDPTLLYWLIFKRRIR